MPELRPTDDDSAAYFDALMSEEQIPEAPYVNTADLLCILSHCGGALSVDGQRWLLRLLSDAFEEPNEADRKLLPEAWSQPLKDEQDRWAAEDEALAYAAEQWDLYCHAMHRDD
jgi:hypothetical protein